MLTVPFRRMLIVFSTIENKHFYSQLSSYQTPKAKLLAGGKSRRADVNSVHGAIKQGNLPEARVGPNISRIILISSIM